MNKLNFPDFDKHTLMSCTEKYKSLLSLQMDILAKFSQWQIEIN